MKLEFKKYFSKLGSKGGKNRMKSMTKEQRKEFSLKGVKARQTKAELWRKTA